ncbi:MAG TPA: ribonuclease H [Ktedonobacteraceae bacterium]|nr:ribonuclease H [Ktedonobacteraceae bacterium]
MIDNSLEWQSILTSLKEISVEKARATLGDKGVIAYTDGACIKNPGGPAGWSTILVPREAVVNGSVQAGAERIECFGHIPKSPATTNNRAEISAVLATLSLAPRDCPLTIYSDSEYTIKVAQGVYKMKANPDLWALYQILLGKRKVAPVFEWVRGHAGHDQNERADELAGLGAWNGNVDAYRKWQESNAPEARNAPPAAEMAALRQQVQKLNAFFETIAVDSGRVAANERSFIRKMAKSFLKNIFVPSPAQSNWIKGLAKKYHV